VRHKYHGNCSHALEEDAPKVLGHGPILKWAIVATERRTPWSGRVPSEMAGLKFNVGIQYILPRNSMGGYNYILIGFIDAKDDAT